MKLAIIGSRTITEIDLAQYIQSEITEIVSGGASGVDTAVGYKRFAWIFGVGGVPLPAQAAGAPIFSKMRKWGKESF